MHNEKNIENSTPCKIVAPVNFNLKIGRRDYIVDVTHHATFGSYRFSGGLSPNRRNITLQAWICLKRQSAAQEIYHYRDFFLRRFFAHAPILIRWMAQTMCFRFPPEDGRCLRRNVEASCHKHFVVVSRHKQTPPLTSDSVINSPRSVAAECIALAAPSVHSTWWRWWSHTLAQNRDFCLPQPHSTPR